ncbi:DUF2867 domain-containing protein [Ideonella azotifigens]|uniref:DUF2867 domain-containing protein n=1 Tax=Ideonella azotifigens TaxID=513160 RepID=A0ABN1JWK3_9BURK|nr:DUF2867 domain-containing protein [Ideonella azotifigens]MCD2341201.1 DUF2867 domain-containing protein [Ideonella azotifigens]
MTASLALPPGAARRKTVQTATFPSVTLPTGPGRVPVEVSLVAQLGHGAGTKLFFQALARQQRHARFVDELDEPSAKLGSTDFAKGDATALYSFGVGHGGHPFHRHAGHRVFTAISGSGGAQLRFSSATPAELAQDPESFLRALRHVNVPPDCLFTVRFSGETWHQFAPLHAHLGHPAFFALSTHTNELGGALSDAMRQQVLADQGDIPSLTELLPAAIAQLLNAAQPKPGEVPTTALSLHDRPGSLLEAACKRYRSGVGHLHRLRAGFWTRPGFVSTLHPARVLEAQELASHSLLRHELTDRTVHHQDSFSMLVPAPEPAAFDASQWLAALLDGFLDNPPLGVSRLMTIRNALVRPLKLRTSPLGCPVSSLLAPTTHARFAERFPVRAQEISPDGRLAQVILGADDRHLMFRTCASVRLLDNGAIEFSLATRVACKNLFGRLYMAAIAATHRQYIAPTMLAHAVTSALGQRTHPAPG